MRTNTKHFIVVDGQKKSFHAAMLEIANAGAYFSAITKMRKGFFEDAQAAFDWHFRRAEERRNPKLTASQKLLLRYANERLAIIKHYTNGALACVQCGEARYRALCIDHINANGNAARKGRASQTELREIIRNGFPDTYQILCHNCNYCKYHEVDRPKRAGS